LQCAATVTSGFSSFAAGRSNATRALAGSANAAQHMAIGSNNNVRGMCPLLLGVACSNVLCAAQMGFDLYQSLQTDFWRMRRLAELLAHVFARTEL
jgi:hypothetical protein